MEEQRTKARTAREVTNYMGADATVYDEIDASVTTEFVGYDHLTDESKVTCIDHRYRDRGSTDRWTDGNHLRREDSILCNHGWTGRR